MRWLRKARHELARDDVVPEILFLEELHRFALRVFLSFSFADNLISLLVFFSIMMLLTLVFNSL